MASPKQRIDEAFARGEREGRALLMPFFVCGYPDPDTFVELTRAAAEAGADILEIGLPFSDPIMDGPVIQAATFEVLSRGQTMDAALALLARASEASGLPLVAMTYYNLMFRRGPDAAARALADAGACGAIIPDLSVEESDDWRKACAAAQVASVFLAAQTSTDERLRALGEASEGFVYAASLMGVTGVRTAVNDRARALVERIRAACDRPVALGIGVSTPEHARDVASYADGVIVGSALVQRIGDADHPVEAAGEFLRDLRNAVSG